MLFMAKEVCVLFVCDNFSFLLVQSFMHKLLYVQKLCTQSPLCEPLALCKAQRQWAEASDEPNSTTQGFLFNPHI
jgi:hypothetical protein